MAPRDERNAPAQGPTFDPPPPSGLTPVLERNIEALHRRRQQEVRAASVQERMADAITRFTGSLPFVYLHLLVCGFWIIANLHWIPYVSAWDESFIILAMVASVEAIFLSTFVLITQNRMAATADRRADLDLQIGLLAEHEITRLTTLVSAIADRLGVSTPNAEEVAEIQQDVAPEVVLEEIEKRAAPP